MTDIRHRRSGLLTGLSARLLALTILFVMLAEILIYLPSIARFRKAYLEDQIAKAHIAILALEATPGNMVSDKLKQALLFHAGAYAVVLTEPQRRVLMLGEDMPPSVDLTVDIRAPMFFEWIGQALTTLVQNRNRVLRVIGPSPRQPSATLEVVLDETPMREAMLGYSTRILTLSIVISLVTAGLVFFSLQWLMVRPIVQLTEGMVRFRERPEDEVVAIRQSGRSDEIGTAHRELVAMQTDVRAALRQKTRLAALGAAVAKINHDLRNTLSTAVLASERLAEIADPEVQRVTPRLYNAIERAVTLCTQTLDFIRDVKPTLHPVAFRLADLVHEIDEETAVECGSLRQITWRGGEVILEADRDQLSRVFANLVRNAGQAGARSLSVEARVSDGWLMIDLADDGPGLPADVRARLFQPFAGTGRSGGSGLGLAIAREIVHAHGGKLTLAATGPGGTVFRIELPLASDPRPPRH